MIPLEAMYRRSWCRAPPSDDRQQQGQYNYLCTYDLYGPAHKVFDAGG